MSSTIIRPELSKSSDYWINRHRYYELMHFCRQYPLWKKVVASIDSRVKSPTELAAFAKKYDISDPVADAAEAREYYTNRIEMVEKAARDTDTILAPYILKGVTEGLSYTALRAQSTIPCNKDAYYELYHKFFYILSEARK